MKLPHYLLLSAVWVAALVATKTVPASAETLDVSLSMPGSGSWDNIIDPFAGDDESDDNSFEPSVGVDESDGDNDLLRDSDDSVEPLEPSRALAQKEPEITPHLKESLEAALPVHFSRTPPTEVPLPNLSELPERSEMKLKLSGALELPTRGGAKANLRGPGKGGKL